MADSTRPIEKKSRCSWCRGTGDGAQWGRPDLGGAYFDSDACRACNGTGEEIALLCPVTCLLGTPCNAVMGMQPGGFQGPVFYVHRFTCGNGHNFDQTYNHFGETVWLRTPDVAMQPVAAVA